MLQGKNAIVYGAAGSLGAGIATAFAAAGARVFLAGRTRERLDRVAEGIAAAGGRADVAVLDALDEPAVQEHVRAVAAEAGSLDVSINLVNRGDAQGIPLVDLPTADFLRVFTTGLAANVITARAAARQMAQQGSGVILALNSGSANGAQPMMGSTGPADAAADTFLRSLAAEVGPAGVRAVGLWIAGVPDTLTPDKLAAVNPNLRLTDDALAGLLGQLDQLRMLRRSPRVADVAAVATFLASDRAGGITGTFVNVTGGMFAS